MNYYSSEVVPVCENIAADERQELAEIYSKLTPAARERLLAYAKTIAATQDAEGETGDEET